MSHTTFSALLAFACATAGTGARAQSTATVTFLRSTWSAGTGISVSPASVEIPYDGLYGTLPTPTPASGSGTFVGWFGEHGCTRRIIPERTLLQNANHNIYALFVAVQTAVVRQDLHGGTYNGFPGPFDYTIPRQGVTGLSLNYGNFLILFTPARAGFTFTGWHLDPALGGGLISSNTSLPTAASPSPIHAHWDPNPITSPFSDIAQPTTLTWYRGEPVTYALPGTNLASVAGADITGYALTGMNPFVQSWPEFSVSADGVFHGTVPLGISTTPANPYTITVRLSASNGAFISKTFTIQIQARTHTLNFTASPGTVSTASKTITTGNTYQSGTGGWPTPTYTPDYAFLGWWTGAGGTGYAIAATNIVPASPPTRVYAYWEPIRTLSFDANGGVITSGAGSWAVPQNQPYGGAAPGAARTGHTLTGWYDTPGANGGTAFAPADRMGGADTTFWARWSPNPVGGAFTNAANAHLGSRARDMALTGANALALPAADAGPGVTFTYALEPGHTLPPGLTLGSDGTLTGTVAYDAPVQTNAFSVIATASSSAAATNTFTLEIVHAPPVLFTFDPNHAAAASPGPTRHYLLGEAFGAFPLVTRKGFTFDGWFPAPDGSGGEVTAETRVTPSSPHTLYAQWALAPGVIILPVQPPVVFISPPGLIILPDDVDEDPFTGAIVLPGFDGTVSTDDDLIIPNGTYDPDTGLITANDGPGGIFTASGVLFILPEGGGDILPDGDGAYTLPEGTGVFVYLPPMTLVLAPVPAGTVYDPSVPALILPDGTVYPIPPYAEEALRIIAIRVTGGQVELDVTGCVNCGKDYTIFGYSDLTATGGLGGHEIEGILRHRPANGSDGTHTFTFPQPAADRYFFRLRDL